jgi:hypothetical protein
LNWFWVWFRLPLLPRARPARLTRAGKREEGPEAHGGGAPRACALSAESASEAPSAQRQRAARQRQLHAPCAASCQCRAVFMRAPPRRPKKGEPETPHDSRANANANAKCHDEDEAPHEARHSTAYVEGTTTTTPSVQSTDPRERGNQVRQARTSSKHSSTADPVRAKGTRPITCSGAAAVLLVRAHLLVAYFN